MMTAPKADPATGSNNHKAHGGAKSHHGARDTASDVARRTAAAIETNPLAILVGGAAIGALAGALVPRSAKERELLAPLGQRLGDTARQALAAAREAGKEELGNAGLTPDAARERGRSLLDGVGKALASAGSAAAHSTRASDKGNAGA
ncbi:hypothetical protein Q5H91_02465 [Sphingomonas sp. KR1UV-12]|uniref:YtxH domain-containing protein n=1 Tax=Sphingomonas aurea TaxID=3063994 RepID=A0ABT9EGT8_9SPHN|nr:hypothetical protein [Sphingomonas sp. KR1UV-12]MDP1026062.1 hypothetical protein [Sphingomonas sp. KR1UV-12]